ncbi:MAG: hypothetical protein ABJB66_07540 [Gemmatimonadaceae bacterium]
MATLGNPVITARAQEVLFEGEAALRLVDHELHELHDVDIMGSVEAHLACDCFARLELATEDVAGALSRLREGRSHMVANRDHAAEQLAFAVSLLDELEVGLTEIARHCVSARN